MKPHVFILTGMLMVVAGLVALVPSEAFGDQASVDKARGELTKQGYKVDLSQFDFSTSDEMRARVAPLARPRPISIRRHWPTGQLPQLMTPIGSNKAIVLWQQEYWNDGGTTNLWPALPEAMADNQEFWDLAIPALLSGPLRFDLPSSRGSVILLPHIATMRSLPQIFGVRGLLDLHEQKPDAAWTNFLAATRSVTAWETEPLEISQAVRFKCVEIVFDVTWQALQYDNWSDQQLRQLQREWETVDFFKALPETVAFVRASRAFECQQERKAPPRYGLPSVRQFVDSPKAGVEELKAVSRESQYRNAGTYDDEEAILRFYRDREAEEKQAVQCQTWPEMKKICGTTNNLIYMSPYPSAAQTRAKLKQFGLASQSGGLGLTAQAAEAEARKRIILAAIALQRYHLGHTNYPETLAKLVPEFLKNAPVDFMDGKALRYRLTDDGHFVLYSVGLGEADNGGALAEPEESNVPYLRTRGRMGRNQNIALVWPAPASQADADAFLKAKDLKANAARVAARKLSEEQENERELARQARVKELLTQADQGSKRPALKDPKFDGKPLSKALAGKTPHTPPLTLDEMLTLKQVTSGHEPDVVAFELPINYDTLTNIGEVKLLVDAALEEPGWCEAILASLERSSNGNCRLVWNTTYDRPGQHALQVFFTGSFRMDSSVQVMGPPLPFYSSNLLQFTESTSFFSNKGGTLYARLAESNANYIIKLRSPDGKPFRTFTGTVTNGVIAVDWDLKDDQGNAYTNESMDANFEVNFPDSGRKAVSHQ